ncbi:MAG: sugar nucleotide-binding protein [Sphingopyxis sp.]
MLSGHEARAYDIERFAGLGLSALRYPMLWEAFAAADDAPRLWAWHDERLARLRTLGIEPIVGLIHHGSGPPTTDLLAPGFAEGLAGHAAAVAGRYPWIRDWTPVNEPLTTARFAALYGHWYPHARDEQAFWLALINQVDAIRRAMTEIRKANPAARLIQTEDIGRTDATPQLQPQAEFDNLRRWGSWDLLTGRVGEQHALWERLTGMGFAQQLEQLVERPCPPDVLGLNHYLTSDRFLDHRLDLYGAERRGHCPLGPLADVETVRVLGSSPGLEGALRESWGRYGLPMAITEVHNGCTREEQMRWLDEAWKAAILLRGEGLPIEAITAWSLLGAHDWDSLLTRDAGHYESGVFDIRGPAPRETALAPMMRTLAAGEAFDHPVLANAGWWRGHSRLAPAGESSGREPKPRGRPLLIAGATGTLGQAFAGACRLRGIDHILTGRDLMDVCEPRSVASVLDDLDPWAVVNCAGWVRVDEAERHPAACLAVNHGASVALARACAARAIHYTAFSSDLVFVKRRSKGTPDRRRRGTPFSDNMMLVC